jgi:hypothetical protein
MFRTILSVTGVAVALAAAPASAQVGGTYEIQNYYSGDAISGAGTGTQVLDNGAGVRGSTTITGGVSPVVIAQGTIAPGAQAFLRMSAIYTYNTQIQAANAPAANALTQVFISGSNRSAVVVGHATGVFRVSGSSNSDTTLRLEASSEYGGDSMSVSCDSGYCSGPDGLAPSGVDVPYSMVLTMADFGYGCFVGPCMIAPNSSPYSQLRLTAQAGVGYTTDGFGNSLGGSVYAMLDPTITLDPGFFTANGLDPNDYSATLAAAAAAVPEPTTWAMLICGFGLVGGAMRRRRGTGRAPIAA